MVSGIKTLKKFSEKVRSITKNKVRLLEKKRQNGSAKSELENLGLDGSNLENLDLDNTSVSNQAIIIIFVLLIIIILLLINATNSTTEPEPEPEPEPACSCSDPESLPLVQDSNSVSKILVSGNYGTEGTCTCYTINEDCLMNEDNTDTINIYGDVSIENNDIYVSALGTVNIYGDLYLIGDKSVFNVSNKFYINGNVYLNGIQCSFNNAGSSDLNNDIILTGKLSYFKVGCASKMTVNNITFNQTTAYGIIIGDNNSGGCPEGCTETAGTLTCTSVNNKNQVISCCTDCFNITGSSTSS